MNFFKHFTQGGALTELLLEGHNPYAADKLPTADVDALRQQLATSESLRAYASGRVVGAGRGVWAVTEQALLLLDASGPRVQRLPLAEVASFEAERGRYGHTLRLALGGQQWSLFGVDAALARLMHEALQASGVDSRFDDRPARSAFWRDARPEGWTQDCLVDLRRRLALA